jgi:hypothetical protein
MLTAIYEQWRSRAKSEIAQIGDCFHPPVLVQQPPDWVNATHRVAYIGQETLGWRWIKNDPDDRYYTWEYEDIETLQKFIEYDRSVEALMYGYTQFDFSAHQPKNLNGPFWRYFHKLRETLRNKAGSVSAIASNVIRCAADSESGFTLWSISETDRRTYLRWQKGLLQAELTELRPTLIVFVTGPNYESYLKDEFDQLSYEPVSSFELKVLSKLVSPRLIAPAYRTYHPGYLNRKFRSLGLACGFAPLEAIIADALKL